MGGNRTDVALLELIRSSRQTVSRPSHCGVRFTQVEERETPYIRVTQQAESVVGSGGRRLGLLMILVGLQMEHKTITAVGIDVSKGKSTVAVRRPGGEVVLTPFQVEHDAAGLSRLVKTLRDIDGDIRIVMEHTGMYWRPIALALKEAGFFVSVVNAMLIHDFSESDGFRHCV